MPVKLSEGMMNDLHATYTSLRPLIGEIAPPRRWYLPRYSPLFSMGTRSVGLSTTHKRSSRRAASVQIAHGSWSAMLKQREQRITASGMPAMVSPSSRTDCAGILSMWSARRVAVFSPTPGSFDNWAMSLLNGLGYDIGQNSPRRFSPPVIFAISSAIILRDRE